MSVIARAALAASTSAAAPAAFARGAACAAAREYARRADEARVQRAVEVVVNEDDGVRGEEHVRAERDGAHLKEAEGSHRDQKGSEGIRRHP